MVGEMKFRIITRKTNIRHLIVRSCKNTIVKGVENNLDFVLNYKERVDDDADVILLFRSDIVKITTWFLHMM